jgi:hypothetical protein
MEEANIPMTSKKVSTGIPWRTWMFLNRLSGTSGVCCGGACCADTRAEVAPSTHMVAVAMTQMIGHIRPNRMSRRIYRIAPPE